MEHAMLIIYDTMNNGSSVYITMSTFFDKCKHKNI
ncbi:hypothetical protein T4D_15558 [Trichinella pseudospiralis]|uniref:Uncharacterized protein n=1 Tax=Trichinella pseudospiralis TaxID=6337 RepID=A0A0V1F4H7_TRIPS|nr:hypothetical protein T4D_15558 [Trichinella pseudospiralis]